MPELVKLEDIEIPLEYRYTIPYRSVNTSYNRSFSARMGQALVNNVVFTLSNPLRVYSVLCEPTRYIVFRTSTLPTGAGNDLGMYTTGYVGSKPNTYQYRVFNTESGTAAGDNFVAYQFSGLPIGTPPTVIDIGGVPSVYNFPSFTNDAQMGPYRLGWDAWGRPLGFLGGIRVNGNPSTTPKILLTDTNQQIPNVDIPLSAVDMQRAFDQNGGHAIGPYSWGTNPLTFGNDSWRAISMNNNLGQVINTNILSPFTPIVQSLTLSDATLNTFFVANGAFLSQNNFKVCGRAGWIVTLPAAPSIFAGQGTRMILIRRGMRVYHEIKLLPQDSISTARIAETNFSLIITESGIAFGKTTTGNAASDQILSSPIPPIQILPKLVPWSGLPRYGIYDKPYGVQR